MEFINEPLIKNDLIVISHPFGNANVRSALYGLNQAGLIDRFFTTVAVYPGNYFDQLSRLPGMQSIARRKFDPLLKERTSLHPWHEIIRLLALQCNLNFLVEHSKGFFCTDRIIQHIDKNVSDYISKNNDAQLKAVYAYEDGAIHSFKSAEKKGIRKIYDLPIGYWRVAKDLLEKERERWPEWACTIPTLKDTEQKLIRKDEELKLADAVYVAGSFTASTLDAAHVQKNKIRIIPYGFPDTMGHARSFFNGQSKLKLLYVGSLTQRKGIADVLHLAEYFSSSVSLTLVGKKTTNECNPLNKMLKKHTWFPGLSHAAILELMQSHDALIFPSLFEGFGLVITEAMSQGLPVITTERTCGADLIQHKNNGWLVEAGNKYVLYDTIQEILDKPYLIEEYSRNALNTAKKRPWSVYATELAIAVAKDIIE